MKACRKCGKSLQLIGSHFLCEQGHSEQFETKRQGKNVVAMSLVAVAVLVAGLFFHFFQWGNHGLSVLLADEDKMVQICWELKKYDCVEDSYLSLYKNTGDASYLSELGKLQFRRKNYEASRETYALYFSKETKPEDQESFYYYAHSLARTGKLDAAIEYFDDMLKSKPHVVMVTVVDSYLQILVANNRIKKARSVLQNLKKRSRSAVNVVEHIKKWKKKFSI